MSATKRHLENRQIITVTDVDYDEPENVGKCRDCDTIVTTAYLDGNGDALCILCLSWSGVMCGVCEQAPHVGEEIAVDGDERLLACQPCIDEFYGVNR